MTRMTEREYEQALEDLKNDYDPYYDDPSYDHTEEDFA